MAQQTIDLGAVANDGTGDTPRVGGDKINDNFTELYAGKFAAGVTLASATTTDLGAQTSIYVTVSGTTTITGLGTVASGTVRFVRFSGALTLTHNGTSLILPGAANILTVAGDTAIFISEGSGNWRCWSYVRGALFYGDADIAAVAASGLAAASGSFTPTVTSGSGTITSYTSSGHFYTIGKLMWVELTITITNKGTGAGTLLVSNLPGTTPRRMFIGGIEDGVSGHTIAGKTSAAATTLSMSKYDNTTCIVDNARVQMTGVVEIS